MAFVDIVRNTHSPLSLASNAGAQESGTVKDRVEEREGCHHPR